MVIKQEEPKRRQISVRDHIEISIHQISKISPTYQKREKYDDDEGHETKGHNIHSRFAVTPKILVGRFNFRLADLLLHLILSLQDCRTSADY
jgi:hypothetical protein